MSSMKSMISYSGAWGKIKLRSITRFKGRMLSSSKQSSFATYLADIWDQMGKPQGWETNGSTKPPFARASIPQVLSCHLLTWISRWLCQQPGRAKKKLGVKTTSTSLLSKWNLYSSGVPVVSYLKAYPFALFSVHFGMWWSMFNINIINPRISGLSFYS